MLAGGRAAAAQPHTGQHTDRLGRRHHPRHSGHQGTAGTQGWSQACQGWQEAALAPCHTNILLHGPVSMCLVAGRVCAGLVGRDSARVWGHLGATHQIRSAQGSRQHRGGGGLVRSPAITIVTTNNHITTSHHSALHGKGVNKISRNIIEGAPTMCCLLLVLF